MRLPTDNDRPRFASASGGRAVLASALLAFALAGCYSTWVSVDSGRYVPALPSGLEDYAGLPLVVRSVDHAGVDTEEWYYYDRAFETVYETRPELARYFREGVVRALRGVGMLTERGEFVPATPGGGAALDLLVLSFNDFELRFTARLCWAGRETYRNEFVVQLPDRLTGATALEARAYRFIDEAVVALLSEPGFHSAYFYPIPSATDLASPAATDCTATDMTTDPDGRVTFVRLTGDGERSASQVDEDDLARVDARNSVILGASATGFFPFGSWTGHRLAGVDTTDWPPGTEATQVGPGGGIALEVGGRWHPGIGLLAHLDLAGVSAGNWEEVAASAGTPVSTWIMMLGAQALLFIEIARWDWFGLEAHARLGYLHVLGEETAITHGRTYDLSFFRASFAFGGGIGTTWELRPGCSLRLAADFLGGYPGIAYETNEWEGTTETHPYLSVLVQLGVWLTGEAWQ